MGKVLAIAMLAVRNAVRSRVVLILLAVLLASIVGLPLTIKGDGTAAGFVRILLGYTLGAVTLTLSMATIWAGCAAVSSEIQERQLQLVVTKPVHRVQVWLGKWLGLVVLNAVLLAVAGVVTYGMLMWRTRAGQLAPGEETTLRQEILTARQRVDSVPLQVDAEVFRELAAAQRRGDIPAEVPASEVARAIRENLLRRAYSVPPGGLCEWVFRLPRLPHAGSPLLFRCRLSSSEIGYEPVRGRWEIGRPGDSAPVEVREDIIPTLPHSFSVPAAAFTDGGELVVRYHNEGPARVTVLFPPENGLTLMVYRARFEANLARALGVILLHLAFLAALGVAAGSLFSMPVAAFASFCVLLVVLLGSYVSSADGQAWAAETGGGKVTRAVDVFVRAVSHGVQLLIRPLDAPDPLELLATGELVTAALMWRLFAVKVVLYAGLMALLSSWILNRREIALPST